MTPLYPQRNDGWKNIDNGWQDDDGVLGFASLKDSSGVFHSLVCPLVQGCHQMTADLSELDQNCCAHAQVLPLFLQQQPQDRSSHQQHNSQDHLPLSGYQHLLHHHPSPG